jgi:hypothetical protein
MGPNRIQRSIMGLTPPGQDAPNKRHHSAPMRRDINVMEQPLVVFSPSALKEKSRDVDNPF